MQVNTEKPLTLSNVLGHEIFEQGTFAGPGLSQDCNVLWAAGVGNCELPLADFSILCVAADLEAFFTLMPK